MFFGRILGFPWFPTLLCITSKIFEFSDYWFFLLGIAAACRWFLLVVEGCCWNVQLAKTNVHFTVRKCWHDEKQICVCKGFLFACFFGGTSACVAQFDFWNDCFGGRRAFARPRILKKPQDFLTKLHNHDPKSMSEVGWRVFPIRYSQGPWDASLLAIMICG